MNESMHRKNKEGFGMQTNAPYDNGASKRGDLYFKSGKDACMSSNLKTLHQIFFELLQEKTSMKSSKIMEFSKKNKVQTLSPGKTRKACHKEDEISPTINNFSRK